MAQAKEGPIDPRDAWHPRVDSIRTRGRCLIISPRNYPLTLTLGGALVLANASGNTVIIETPEVAPHCPKCQSRQDLHQHQSIQFLHHNLPFGGVNNSGIGTYRGEWGIKAFSHERAIVRTDVMLAGVFLPPYTRRTTQRLVNFILCAF